MRKQLVGLLAGLALISGYAAATTLPQVPSSATFSEPSQIVATLNALINQLNGLPGGYTANSGTSIPSIGLYCANAAAGATPQVCNGSRGLVAYTGITV